ncbi:MAG: ion channel, partial [Bacteroidota bacterium]
MARQKKKEAFEDLGFGDKLTSTKGARLIRSNGQLNVDRTGFKVIAPYQSLVEMPWGRFLVLVLMTYIFINLFFAMLFCLVGTENLNGIEPSGPLPAFWEAFFFSVQSFTTVGYGAVSPSGFWANVVAALDALTGLMSVALATGLIFARFSKPRANILFSDFGIIAPYRKIKSFQFRIVNKRSNKIIDLEARVTATWLEPLKNGRNKRHFETLKLERSSVFLFPLNWTVVHPIDSDSPLY